MSAEKSRVLKVLVIGGSHTWRNAFFSELKMVFFGKVVLLEAETPADASKYFGENGDIDAVVVNKITTGFPWTLVHLLHVRRGWKNGYFDGPIMGITDEDAPLKVYNECGCTDTSCEYTAVTTLMEVLSLRKASKKAKAAGENVVDLNASGRS